MQDKIRTVIEKSCHIFREGQQSRSINKEQYKRFFKVTFQYLKSKIRDPYQQTKLTREIDLEWQSMLAEENNLEQSTVNEVSRMI